MSRTAAGAVALLVLSTAALVACGGEESGSGDDGERATSTTTSDPPRRAAAELPRTEQDGATTAPPAAPSAPAPTTPPPTTSPSATPPPTTAAPAGAGTVVTDVVDGDTIDVSGGRRIRLIGIDTPERGQCGFAEATALMRWLVQGRAVTLVPGARDDVDSYGRLLRYVEVDGNDVNLAMIRSGRAIARYDGRDGYGRHARQDAYVAADSATPSANTCGGAPATTVAPAPAPGPSPGGSDTRFGTCREAIAAGFGPYRAGADPEYDWYRDADGDGVVCE